MFWVGLAAGFILGGALGLLIGSLMGGERRAAEAEAAHQRRQNQAIIADQERADDIETLARDARRAARDGDVPAAVRLRRAGRIRDPGQ